MQAAQSIVVQGNFAQLLRVVEGVHGQTSNVVLRYIDFHQTFKTLKESR